MPIEVGIRLLAERFQFGIERFGIGARHYLEERDGAAIVVERNFGGKMVPPVAVADIHVDIGENGFFNVADDGSNHNITTQFHNASNFQVVAQGKTVANNSVVGRLQHGRAPFFEMDIAEDAEKILIDGRQ